MEKGICLFFFLDQQAYISISSPNLHLDGLKESCQNDDVIATPARAIGAGSA